MTRYWLTHDRDGYWIVDMQTHQWYSFGLDIEAATRERDRLWEQSEDGPFAWEVLGQAKAAIAKARGEAV